MVYTKKRGIISCIWVILLFIILSFIVLAHGIEDDEEFEDVTVENVVVNLEKYYSDLSIYFSLIGLGIIIILTIISVYYETRIKKYKKHLFISMLILILIVTLFLVGSTIYVNVISETKGPVHWHSDFEIWNCGEKIDIKDPEGLSNRMGSTTFHEHNDNRIHVEGVVVDSRDVDLHNFFKVFGGGFSKNKLVVPTNNGMVELNNGDICNDKESKLQVFLYRVVPNSELKFVYSQEKLEHFVDYVISPYANVPPGDCLIIEFGEEKEKTDHICETYKLAIKEGELIGS